MALKHSRRLVVDTDIALAAGTSEVSSSRVCRELLISILKICHRAVLSPSLSDEWQRHRSAYTAQWQQAMLSRGKLVAVPDVPWPALDTRIAAARPADQKVMSKDAHLVSAARATDCVVLSMDERARGCFADALSKMRGARALIWVNPIEGPDDVQRWLRAGAKIQDPLRLCGSRGPPEPHRRQRPVRRTKGR